MEKKAHQYKLKLEYLNDSKGETMNVDLIELIFENHDNVFSIIEKMKNKDLFNDQQQATEFAIGLKLLAK